MMRVLARAVHLDFSYFVVERKSFGLDNRQSV